MKQVSTLKLETHVFRDNREKNEVEFRKLREMHQDLDISISDVQSYVQTILPIHTQNILTETLVNVLSRSNIKRLTEFNGLKYKNLTSVAESGDPTKYVNLGSYQIPEIKEKLIP